MGTFSVRFGFPDDGFEAYAEIGRGEGFLNPVLGVSDTRLSLIYVLGFARTDTTSSGGRWRVSGELVKQAMELPQPDAPTPDELAVPTVSDATDLETIEEEIDQLNIASPDSDFEELDSDASQL